MPFSSSVFRHIPYTHLLTCLSAFACVCTCATFRLFLFLLCVCILFLTCCLQFSAFIFIFQVSVLLLLLYSLTFHPSVGVRDNFAEVLVGVVGAPCFSRQRFFPVVGSAGQEEATNCHRRTRLRFVQATDVSAEGRRCRGHEIKKETKKTANSER